MVGRELQLVHPLLLKGRFLFVVDDCNYCKVWKAFVDRLNKDLEIGKRIIIVDCTKYHNFGIIEHPIIRLFYRYVEGVYPVLFFEGGRKDGANSVIEAETWLRSRLEGDFVYPQRNPYLFRKECRFIKQGVFKNKISCI